MSIKISLFISLLYISSCASYKDKFYEELLLKPLQGEQLYAYFQFTTIWDTQPTYESCKSRIFISLPSIVSTFFCLVQNCHLFPRALGEIIGRYDIQELHISLTGGLWRYESWGYPVIDAAPGVELWTWFKPNAKNIDQQWKELSNSLSGLLCASLNFIDPSNSLSPEFSFRPKGIVNNLPLNSSYLRYASLPREIVCTENLTPWKKLLPCDSRKGLASLLNSGYIHNTRYHSISLNLRSICRDSSCSTTSLELKQSVSLVYDYLILGSRNWSFRKLFGQGLMESCPLSQSSIVYVDVTNNHTTPFKITPAPNEFITSIRGGDERLYAKYDTKNLSVSVLNIAATYPLNKQLDLDIPPVLHANQYIAGFGQEYGEIVTKIYNNHWGTLDILLLQNLPWYVPVYIHTLKIDSNGKPLLPVHKKFIPGKQRSRPYYLEILLRLPAKSITTVSIDFDYVFLKWQEYPPDANHGFYIGSSVITSYLPLARNYTGLPTDGSLIAAGFNASRSGYLVQVRTESMLITLPTPDFSMPYNVICLACTVVALAFGPLHNITTKRLILKVPKEKFSLTKFFKQLFTKKEKTE